MKNKVPVKSERIALFMPNLAGGGAERVMLNLAEVFTTRGFRVILIVLRAEGELLDQIPNGVSLITLNKSKPRQSIWPLCIILRKFRPAVMLSTLSQLNWVACLATRLARCGTRCVVREANQLSLDGPSRWLRPRLLYWSCRYAQHLSVSQGAADDLERVLGLQDGSVHVIYNPVICESLFNRAAESIEHPWFKRGESPVILAVGRLVEAKGFDVLLNAFAQLPRDRSASLLILGEGPERSALEAQRHRLNLDSNVSFLGYVSNPIAYMAKASVFVLSSRWEGLPGVLIEALACGARIVATDCPSGPKEILDGGRFGRLVPPEDPDTLADALLEALNGAYPKESPTEWLQQFQLDTVADHYLKLMGLAKRSENFLKK